MRTSEQLNEIAAALVACQAEMPAVPKTASNPHFKSKYAPLDAVVKAATPVLAKHGLAIIQAADGLEDGKVAVVTRVIHTSGQWIETTAEMRPRNQDPQGVGASVTYGSRYGYRMVGVVTDEDDDGNSAAGEQKAAPKKNVKTVDGAITSAQRKLLFAAAKDVGLEGDEFKSFLAGLGIESTKDIKASELDALLEEIKKHDDLPYND